MIETRTNTVCHCVVYVPAVMRRQIIPNQNSMKVSARYIVRPQYPSRRSHRSHEIYWAWFQWHVHSVSNVEGDQHSLEHAVGVVDPPAQWW
jgi:hypothetical protein